jgi:hypothetical protein
MSDSEKKVPVNVTLKADAVLVRINRWGVKVDGKELEKMITDALGASETDSYDEVVANITVTVKELPKSIEITNGADAELTLLDDLQKLRAEIKQLRESLEEL